MTPDTAARHREMARAYAAGESVDVIAHRYDCSKSTVRYAVNTHGVPVRPSGRPRKENPLKPAAPAMVRPKCCNRWAVPIEDAVTGEVRSYTCIKCWKGFTQ